MTMAVIPDDAVHLLEGTHLAHIATINADGSPQVTPVWVDHDGDTVLINTARGRLKDRNLARDPRVSISIVDAANPYQPLLIQGKAVEITEDGADGHIDKLAKRYLDEDVYPFRGPGEVRLLVRIAPDRVSYGL
jgi:PPOX class probable F420-dependent enzyme